HRVLPAQLDVMRHARNPDQVEGTLAHNLVRDVHVTALGVARLRGHPSVSASSGQWRSALRTGMGDAWPRPQIEVSSIASSQSSIFSRVMSTLPSKRWWSARFPIRHGVHFWQDSSAKKRIVSASNRLRGYDAGKTWTPAEPGPQPHSASASRVRGTSSAAG